MKAGGGALALAIILMLVSFGSIVGYCSDGATVCDLTIKYDLDGGQGDFPTQYDESVRGSANITIPSEVPFKEGSTFSHWKVTLDIWSAPESPPTEVQPGYTFSVSSSYNILTLTAVWVNDTSSLGFLSDPITDGTITYVGTVYHDVTINNPVDGSTITIQVAHGECVPAEYLPQVHDSRAIQWHIDNIFGDLIYSWTPILEDTYIIGEWTYHGGNEP